MALATALDLAPSFDDDMLDLEDHAQLRELAGAGGKPRDRLAEGFALVRLLQFLTEADGPDTLLHRAVAGLGLLAEVAWVELDGDAPGDLSVALPASGVRPHVLSVGLEFEADDSAAAMVEHVLSLVSRMYERELGVERLRAEATTDPLTGLWNRRGFEPLLDQALARAARTGEAIAVLAIDVDRFKPINDELGHEAGDRALQGVASALQGAIRPSDVAVRLGGDEFAVLLAGSDAEGARLVCERIRRNLQRHAPLGSRTPSLSFGVADLSSLAHPSVGPTGRAALMAAADAALYAAKSAGRDAIVARSAHPAAIDDDSTRPICVRAS